MTDTAFDQESAVAIPSKVIPLRGYSVDREDIGRILQNLQTAVREFGRADVESLARPENMTEDNWTQEKSRIVQNAFNVTTTVNGLDNKSTYAPRIDGVFSSNAPSRISNIYCTNKTAFQQFVGRDPSNKFDFVLDFSSPSWLDGANPISAPTPNASNLAIHGVSEPWVSAIENAVLEPISHSRDSRGILHQALIYDFGLLIFRIPLGFVFAYFVRETLFHHIEGADDFLRSAILSLYLLCIALAVQDRIRLPALGIPDGRIGR